MKKNLELSKNYDWANFVEQLIKRKHVHANCCTQTCEKMQSVYILYDLHQTPGPYFYSWVIYIDWRHRFLKYIIHQRINIKHAIEKDGGQERTSWRQWGFSTSVSMKYCTLGSFYVLVAVLFKIDWMLE